MKFNKTLHPSDYKHLETQVALFEDVTSKIDAIIHHKHRRWEYGVAIAALDLIRPQSTSLSILDIGSGGSPLPAMLATLGHDVTVIDPSLDAGRQHKFNEKLGVHINVVNKNYMLINDIFPYTADVTFCISTLEHIERDIDCFKRILQHTQKLVVFTVDYHPSGAKQTPHHLRSYNRESLETMAALAGDEWELVDTPEWVDHGAQVFDYNFASLVLRRKEKTGGYLAIPDQISTETLDKAWQSRKEWLNSDEAQKPKETKPKQTRKSKKATAEK